MKHLSVFLIFPLLLVSAFSCRNEPKTPSPAPAPPLAEKAQTSSPEGAATDSVLIEKKGVEKEARPENESSENPKTPPPPSPKPQAPNPKPQQTPEGFSDIEALDASILMDIRYATTDNFTKSKIYDCPRCLLRPEAAAALLAAHKSLKKKGLGLKMFDCFRPRPYQQRLWDKVPDPNYVTPPAKGSMHSRGAAVDLTIVDKNGKELDMGTPYDFFGKEAHFDFLKLPENVLANRRLLRETMEAAGFAGIRTEWWHFSFRGKEFPLCAEVWGCD